MVWVVADSGLLPFLFLSAGGGREEGGGARLPVVTEMGSVVREELVPFPTLHAIHYTARGTVCRWGPRDGVVRVEKLVESVGAWVWGFWGRAGDVRANAKVGSGRCRMNEPPLLASSACCPAVKSFLRLVYSDLPSKQLKMFILFNYKLVPPKK